MLFQRINSEQRKLISISFQNTRSRSWTLETGWCSAPFATDFELGECYCNNASGGQNPKSWLILLTAYSEKSHWTLLPKHFGLFVSTEPEPTQTSWVWLLNVQTEQLWKEFLDPGLNSWGCEIGGRKKNPKLVLDHCGSPDYIILHFTFNLHYIFAGKTAWIKSSFSQPTLISL